MDGSFTSWTTEGTHNTSEQIIDVHDLEQKRAELEAHGLEVSKLARDQQ